MQSMLFQDVVKLECIRGYEFHGRPNVKCLPTGVWSKINGICSSKIEVTKELLIGNTKYFPSLQKYPATNQRVAR